MSNHDSNVMPVTELLARYTYRHEDLRNAVSLGRLRAELFVNDLKNDQLGVLQLSDIIEVCSRDMLSNDALLQMYWREFCFTIQKALNQSEC
ncbi:hypothetical protein SMBr_15200 [Shewanella sp. M-Br]|nr:hypothetical protein SMBr_15200 [Shewanella sp. M-Br]